MLVTMMFERKAPLRGGIPNSRCGSNSTNHAVRPTTRIRQS